MNQDEDFEKRNKNNKCKISVKFKLLFRLLRKIVM